MMNRTLVFMSVLCVVFVLPAAAQPIRINRLPTKPALVRLIDGSLKQAANQYKVLMGKLPADRLPKTYFANTDKVETSGSDWWCSGFYPGTLLNLYGFTKDTTLKREALQRLSLLENEQFNKGTHDLGFMMYCSFGNARRVLGQDSYNEILLNSAKSLASRFNPKVGCIRSWDSKPWTYPVIIDNMMNLELLFWATQYTGDSSYYRIAVTHANTTLRNHFRPNFSSYHVVDYDPETGNVIAKKTAQGFSDSSSWARGQSWGLYGYTVMYRATHDRTYLDLAQRIAQFILTNPALPADKIPVWDYDAQGSLRAYRDASAASILASALIELSHYVDAEKGQHYLDVAEQIIVALSGNMYKAVVGSNGGFILKHSVGNIPGKSEVDVPLTYADYYYVEAMLRYKNYNNLKASGYVASVEPKTRMSSVGEGWARNSVNTVIFRHNSIVSSGDMQYISYYDSAGALVLGKRSAGAKDWITVTTPYKGHVADAHNTISLIADGDGYLHVAFDHHNNTLHYCRSVSPGSLELSPMMAMTGKHEEKVTYPEFYKMPDGDLLFLYRDGASGNGNLVVNRYDHKKKVWDQLQSDLIDGEGHRNAYWQACLDDRGRIHLSWVWRESPDVASNHDICYARSEDGGRTWEKSNGDVYKLPINAATAEYAWRVPQRSELINQTSMCADRSGQPFIATYWRSERSKVPQYQLVYKEGEKWSRKELTQRTTPFSLSGGGTKQVPVSRPQILVGEKDGRQQALLVYRDAERGDKVSLAVCSDFPRGGWQTTDLTDSGVGAWEPSYDTEAWRLRRELNLFVQRTAQGDGETLTDAAPAMVAVLEWKL